MATLNIGGQSVNVDDSFLSLSPDQQNATVDEIAKSLPSTNVQTAGESNSSPQRSMADMVANPPRNQDGSIDLQALAAAKRGNILSDIAATPRAISTQIPFADRAKAALGAATGVGGSLGDYSGNLQQEQKANAAVDPYTKAAAILPISAATALIAGPLSGLFKGAQVAGEAAAPIIENAPTVLQTAINTGKIGGLAGAVSGVSSSKDLTDLPDVAKNAGLGLLEGGALGATLGAVGHGVTAGLDKYWFGSPARNLGISSPAAQDMLTRVLASDSAVGPGNAVKNITAAGPNAMLADAGPATQGVLDTAIQSGGPATSLATNAIAKRAELASQSISSALDKTLGPPVGLGSEAASIRAETAPAVSDAYKLAYSKPIDYNSEKGQKLLELLNRVPTKAHTYANELMLGETGNTSGAVAQPTLPPPGSRISVNDLKALQAQMAQPATTNPDVQRIDYLTRGLGRYIDSDTKGALGGMTETSRVYTGVKSSIRNALRDLVPEYGQALDTVSDPISRIQAMKIGAQALSPSMTRDELKVAVSGMTQPELDAAKQGLRSAIDESLSNVKASATNPNVDIKEGMKALQMLSPRSAFAKLSVLMDPQDARLLTNEIAKNAKALQLYAGTAANSRTFGRQAMQAAADALNQPGVVRKAIGLKPVQALQAGTDYLTGQTPQQQLAKSDMMHQQIAEVLTGLRGEDAISAMQSLLRQGQINTGQPNTLMPLLAGTASGLSQPSLPRR